MTDLLDGLLLAGCLLLAAAALLLWALFGRDGKREEGRQAFPPAGLTSADLGFALDGDASYNDVV